jgi:hypothetical protein
MLITKLLTPKSPIDIKTVSRLFSSYENVSLRNVVIPIGYGRLKIGSIIIANSISFIVRNEDQNSEVASIYKAIQEQNFERRDAP